MAPIHHQLGMVAHQRKDYDRAHEHYRATLESELAAKDWYRAASAHHQLGILAMDRGQPETAEREFREALRLKEEIGAHHEAVVTHCALATLCHDQGRPEHAVEQLLRAALASYKSSGRWPIDTFPLLRENRSTLDPIAYDRLVEAVIPSELRDKWTAAIDPDPSKDQA
jgi:tetratricopeptide (TPR) repeat protein